MCFGDASKVFGHWLRGCNTYSNLDWHIDGIIKHVICPVPIDQVEMNLKILPVWIGRRDRTSLWSMLYLLVTSNDFPRRFSIFIDVCGCSCAKRTICALTRNVAVSCVQFHLTETPCNTAENFQEATRWLPNDSADLLPIS